MGDFHYVTNLETSENLKSGWDLGQASNKFLSFLIQKVHFQNSSFTFTIFFE